MEIPFPEKPDPQAKLIEFKRPQREGTLRPVRKTYDSCKHASCFVDEGKREVTCQSCKVLLDPFTVLYEMAMKQRQWLEELDQWDARRDSILSERYDAQWEKDKAEVRSPPSDPETLRIWRTFEGYLKGKFVSMYRRKARLRSGPEWYGRSSDGGMVSFEYARSQMVPKMVAPAESQVRV